MGTFSLCFSKCRTSELNTCSLVRLPWFNVAKIVSPSAAFSSLVSTNVCVCVCVSLSVCGMLWLLAGAKFSPRQVKPRCNCCSHVLSVPEPKSLLQISRPIVKLSGECRRPPHSWASLRPQKVDTHMHTHTKEKPQTLAKTTLKPVDFPPNFPVSWPKKKTRRAVQQDSRLEKPYGTHYGECNKNHFVLCDGNECRKQWCHAAWLPTRLAHSLLIWNRTIRPTPDLFRVRLMIFSIRQVSFAF